MIESFLSEHLERDDKFLSENAEGNIEYKLRLDLKDQSQQKKLTSQLLWRLNEGLNLFSKEVAIYVIGIYDNGTLGGVSYEAIINSVIVLQSILAKINATIFEEKYLVINNSNIYICAIQIVPKKLRISELNVMLCGGSFSGKSSIIANLCNDVLDSGNGTIRNYVLKHPHEKITGQTTSISKEIIGVRNDSILNYTYSNNWAELLELSQRVISLYDTPGDLKYIQNIINGILSYQIDMLLIIDIYTIHKELSPFTLFLEKICHRTRIPYKIILNKCDQIEELHSEPNSEPNSELHSEHLALSVKNGLNLEQLKHFLINLKKNKNQPLSYINNYYRITESYTIPHIGKILTGIQIKGELYQNMSVKVITNSNSDTYDSKVISIYKKYTPTDTIYEDESGSINLVLEQSIRLDRNSIIIPSKDYNLIQFHQKIKVEIFNQDKIDFTEKYIFLNGNNISECTLENPLLENSLLEETLSKNFILIFPKEIILQNNLFVLIPYYKQYNILNNILIGNIEIEKN